MTMTLLLFVTAAVYTATLGPVLVSQLRRPTEQVEGVLRTA